jgi:hypothetical protein
MTGDVAGHALLNKELRAEPPAEFAVLTGANAEHLGGLLRHSRKTQLAELEAAVEEALKRIPRPLRGAVKKAAGL